MSLPATITVLVIQPNSLNKIVVVDATATQTIGIAQGIPGAPGTPGSPGPPGPPGPGTDVGYLVKTADYFPQFTDAAVGGDCSENAITFTLPISNSLNVGETIYTNKIDSTPNVLTIITQEGQLINGIANTFLQFLPNQADGFRSTGNGYTVF